MAIRLADFFVGIGARTGELTRELTRTRRQTSTWSKDITRLTNVAAGSFLAISGAVAGLGAALTLTFKARSEYLGTLGATAAKLGENTEELSRLRLAAEIGGVGVNTMDQALQRMVRRLSEAANGGGEALGAINELGLDAKALARANPAEAFTQIVDALGNVELQGDRVRNTFKFFDSEGVALVNVTREVLQQATDDLRAMGGALNSIEVGQVDAAGTAVLRIARGADLIRDRFTLAAAPAVEAFANEIFGTFQKSDDLQEKIEELTRSALLGFAELTGKTATVLTAIDGREEIAEFGAVGYLLFGRKGLLVGALLGAVYDDLRSIADTAYEVILGPSDAAGKLEEQLVTLEQTQTLLNRTAQTPGVLESQEKLARKIADTRAQLESFKNLTSEIPGSLEPPKSAFEQLSAVLNNTEAALRRSAAAVGTVIETAQGSSEPIITDPEDKPGDKDEDKEETQPEVKPVGPPDLITGFRTKEQDDVDANDKYLEEQEAEREHQEELSRIRGRYHSQALAQKKRFEDFATLFNEAGAKERGRILFEETKNSLAVLATGSKTFFKINKIASIANAVVSVHQGIAKALAIGPPAGFALAALVALEGAATIKTINSTEYGGSSSVYSPGSGGIGTVGDVTTGSVPAVDDDAFTDTTSEPTVQIVVYASPGTSQAQRDQAFTDSLQRLQENGQVRPGQPIEVVHRDDSGLRVAGF